MAHSSRRSLRTATVLIGAVALGAVGATAAPAAAPAATGELYIIHGVPGAVVDVMVDGETVQEDAEARQIVGPLEQPSGVHQVSLVPSGSDEPLLDSEVDVPAGGSVDLVAHQQADASAEPVLTAFLNDTSPVGAGKSRLVIAHTAAVPPADIRVDGAVLFENVANGEELTLTVPEQTYTVDIVPTGATEPVVFGPVDLPVGAGTLTRVFALGNPQESTMDAVVHVLPASESGAAVPSLVATGSGGQAAALQSADGARPGLMAAGAALLALLGVTMATRRRARTVAGRRDHP